MKQAFMKKYFLKNQGFVDHFQNIPLKTQPSSDISSKFDKMFDVLK